MKFMPSPWYNARQPLRLRYTICPDFRDDWRAPRTENSVGVSEQKDTGVCGHSSFIIPYYYCHRICCIFPPPPLHGLEKYGYATVNIVAMSREFIHKVWSGEYVETTVEYYHDHYIWGEHNLLFNIKCTDARPKHRLLVPLRSSRQLI